MTGAAQVDPAAVQDLSSALHRYVVDAERAGAESHRQVEQLIREVFDELGRRKAELNQAQAALQSCLRDPTNNCSQLEQQLRRAHDRVTSAQQAARLLDGAAAAFAVATSRFDRVTGTIVRDCQTVLKDVLSDVAAYLARSSAAGQSAIAPASGFAPGGSDGTASSRDVPAVPTSTVPPGFPDDMEMVPTELIDDGEAPIHGPEDFTKGYTPQDLRWGFDALHDVVLPAMARGKGAGYFSERDASEGRIGTKSYEMTFAGFFSTDDRPVVTRLPNGRYRMTGNGRHRLWVARTYGIPAIPAQVD